MQLMMKRLTFLHLILLVGPHLWPFPKLQEAHSTKGMYIGGTTLNNHRERPQPQEDRPHIISATLPLPRSRPVEPPPPAPLEVGPPFLVPLLRLQSYPLMHLAQDVVHREQWTLFRP